MVAYGRIHSFHKVMQWYFFRFDGQSHQHLCQIFWAQHMIQFWKNIHKKRMVCFWQISVNTLVHVVVLPLPWRPTNMMMLFCPLTGCHAFTPGSINYKQLQLHISQTITMYK